MTTVFDGMLALWSWPLQMAKLGSDMAETAVGAQRVVGARMPVIEAAMRNPFTADHAELGLMVSEKVAAFGKSGRSVSAAGGKMGRAAKANAAAAGKMASGRILWPTDWLQLMETNLAAATAFAELPAAALHPIHSGVKANERRLKRT
ncbi:hypothetical protein PQ455_13345 [Sphingomonas naphthae]|uniref:Antifreeze protein n=1 Tax=Sphingomonas naphthae TaxID=1813468 RepID=A0ABY7TIQ5_9SPHN|nr:hypothetical protein [Sphingomonas naphthae]WCT72612.1 hypothetical protein PQ455_13345 [Sphingomonas naphthae]